MVHVPDPDLRTKADKPAGEPKNCPQKIRLAARNSVILLRHSVVLLGASVLAALSLMGGPADAAAQTAAISVSITIEARCVVSSTDSTGRSGDTGSATALAVHCTGSTPFRVLLSDGQSATLSPASAKPLEIAF